MTSSQLAFHAQGTVSKLCKHADKRSSLMRDREGMQICLCRYVVSDRGRMNHPAFSKMLSVCITTRDDFSFLYSPLTC